MAKKDNGPIDRGRLVNAILAQIRRNTKMIRRIEISSNPGKYSAVILFLKLANTELNIALSSARKVIPNDIDTIGNARAYAYAVHADFEMDNGAD